MMENESLREPKNSALVFVSVVAVALAIWAIVASVKASNLGKEVTQLTAEKEAIKIEAEQIKNECAIRTAEAEKLRQTAMAWTRQHQEAIQAEMRKKAEEAAKQAKAKEEASKKPAAGKPSTIKAKVPVKKTTTAKKAVHHT